jgi:hypothetical protein
MSKAWVDELMHLMCGKDLIPYENIDAAQRLKQSHYPAALYKLREVNDFSLSNLRDRTMHLTFASRFNDPYDSAVNIDPGFGESHAERLLNQMDDISNEDRLAILDADDPVFEIVRHKHKIAGIDDEEASLKFAIFLTESHQKSMAEAKALMIDRVQNTYKICSLTERLDSLPLWAHYAKNHTGFAMEYDFKSLPFDDLMGISLWPVLYKGIFDATDMVRGVAKGESFNNMFALMSALHKSPDWSYEEEWRLVLVDGSNQPPRNFRVPLKAVYLGSKISDDDAVKVVEAAAVAGVPAYKMRLVPHEFRMEPAPDPL